MELEGKRLRPPEVGGWKRGNSRGEGAGRTDDTETEGRGDAENGRYGDMETRVEGIRGQLAAGRRQGTEGGKQRPSREGLPAARLSGGR